MFCENEAKFRKECLAIFLKTDPYDSDKSYEDLFKISDRIVEGFNILQKMIYPDRPEIKYDNKWDGKLIFFKKRPESEI